MLHGDKIEMTPVKVEVLLWYCYSPNDHPNLEAPAVIEAIHDFIKAGIFHRLSTGSSGVCGKRFGVIQDALDVYVNAILEIPLPKQIWVIPQNKEQ